MSLEFTPTKNMTVKNGLIHYNFGIRKPVLNCAELLKQFPWQNLIDKWVYCYENIEDKNIYFKHVFINNRIYQIVYSGIDILGDGVYILYKVDVEYKEENDYNIIPVTFDLDFGSFECEDFLQTLFEKGLITKEDVDIFKNKKELDDFTKSLHQIKE